jgi:ubiquinone/menaquinone biosynthesis C-methylase UbiE
MAIGHKEYLRQEIELHERLADIYTEKRYRPKFSQRYHDHWNKRLADISATPAGGLVLDYGCGTGIFFPELVERGWHVVGLDLSEAMLKAGDPTTKAMPLCADGSHIPVPDETFDTVFCRGSIHHLPDVKLGIEEIGRSLKKGGCLAFSEPSNDSLVNRIARHWMYVNSDEFEEEDEGFYRKEIEPMLTELGFEIEYSRGFGFFAYTFSGFPDKLNLLGHLPGAVFLTNVMIFVDNLLERIPVVNKLALHWQVRARKV